MNKKDAVITLDGPAASGKGTVAKKIAATIGFNYLDSGALYRTVALAAMRRGIAADDEAAIAAMMPTLEIRLSGEKVSLDGEDVSEAIRSADVSMTTSCVAKLPMVRSGLLELQRRALDEAGLVADGRDMGATVFPNAALKIYLDAGLEVRARRRYEQMLAKGVDVGMDLEAYTEQLRLRDEQDKERSESPLKPADDAFILDNSLMSIEETVKKVLDLWNQKKHLV